jgi:hypothetical protein
MNELQARGIKINTNQLAVDQNRFLRNKVERIDMSKYRSPVLTENHLRRLHALTGEVIVPKKTVITPKAREIAKEKNIIITCDT